jgi:hypothetical protein
MTRNKKHHVFGHELQHGLNVTSRGRAMPRRDDVSNSLFVRAQTTSIDDAQQPGADWRESTSPCVEESPFMCASAPTPCLRPA